MIYKTYNGSMLDLLQVIEPNSIDSVVTDPPYELGFMGKSWDATGIAFQPNTWKQCYDALKPGGYLLAFGGSRTFHRIAVAIEDAGFEIRDTIMWLYGSGFPKSHDISKAIDKKLGAKREVVGSKKVMGKDIDIYGAYKGGDYDITLPSTDLAKKYAGYGTCLKPAYEPIIVARKPFKGTVADNVINYGVGGLNIDECRVGEAGGVKKINIEPNSGSKNSGFGCNGQLEELNDGRFPANVIHDGSEEVISGFPDTKSGGTTTEGAINNWGDPRTPYNKIEPNEGNAGRYFYSAKASKKDRDEGLEMLVSKYTASAEFIPNHM